MSYYPLCRELEEASLEEQFAAVTEADVLRAIAKKHCTPGDFLALMSPTAAPFIEDMARKANTLTAQNFGRTIQLFTPLYLSNYCSNHCVYCGFNAKNVIPRSQLTAEQLEVEAKAIAATGLRHLLILTGESRVKASPEYLEECVTLLRNHFPSVSIEIYAMTLEEYINTNAPPQGGTIFIIKEISDGFETVERPRHRQEEGRRGKDRRRHLHPGFRQGKTAGWRSLGSRPRVPDRQGRRYRPVCQIRRQRVLHGRRRADHHA